MDDRQAINAIRDALRNNLTDPRFMYTNKTRDFIHTDNPLDSATFPRIQVRKRGPTSTVKADIGQDFLEWRAMVLDIQFWTTPGFKWKDSNSVYYQDEELVKYYLDQIWVKLKAAQSTLKSSYGITGLLPIAEDDPYLEERPDNSQLFTGIISIRCWYFRT
jgi:hypothetical protein